MAVAPSPSLPHWDLERIYPGPESPELEAHLAAALEHLHAVSALLGEAPPGGSGADDAVERLQTVVARLNAGLEGLETVGAYLYGRIAVNARDEAAQGKMSELRQHEAALDELWSRFTAWVGTLDVDALADRSEALHEHRFVLQRAHRLADRLMPPAAEEVAAELDLAGASAWSRLHQDVTSELRVEHQGRVRPMTEIRNLAHDPDREVRRRALESELRGWESVEVPLAAALNAIKWQVMTLARRRGWASPLDEALYQNHLDRPVLDAMIGAMRDALPDLRRYFRAKARLLGVERLAWYDLFAPVPAAGAEATPDRWSYDRAERFIAGRFGAYSTRLQRFAERAARDRWIDAEPREGKRGGAFCLHVRGDESRILLNYAPSYYGASTLAHELGHGYHNLAQAGLPPLRRRNPMTLAETASTFCETLVRDAALRDAGPAEQLEILEGSLLDNTQVLVDVLGRFLFESRLFERRAARELAPGQLSELMLEAQLETYGDALDPAALHPYMWAVKGHYYSGGLSFYNFPYAFGLLFGLGLLRRYEADPESFVARYDDLLAATGSAEAATLAARFGLELDSPAFWRASLASVIADVDRFEALARG